MVSTQTFSYSDGVETNIGMAMTLGGPVKLTIRMLMVHDVVETFSDDDYTPSNASAWCAPHCLDPWHYGGTVHHNRFKVMDKVFIGDASAIRRPFNCHPSMPAAAIGILASQAALGTLPHDYSISAATLDTMKYNGPL